MENKITQEELEQLNSIQQTTQKIIFDLGNIELNMIMLKKQKTKLTETLNELILEESSFNNSLIIKYGNISLDPNTGEFKLIE